MSIELMSKAFKARVGNQTRKLVLIKIADNADDSGRCFPSYQAIAHACEVDRRTVIRQVNAMQQLGLLTVQKRFIDGENSSNIFTINVKKLEEMGSDTYTPPSDRESPPQCQAVTTLVTESHHPSGTVTPPLVAESHPESSIFNHQLTINEPSLNQESASVLPNWLDVGLWNDWLDSRKKLKAVNSERVLAIILKKLTDWHKQGHNPNSLIETALVNGWKDCYLPKQTNGKPQDDGYAEFVASTERWESRVNGNKQNGNVYDGETA